MSDSPAYGGVSKGCTSSAHPLLFSPYRLPGKDYAALFEQGHSFACRTLILRWIPNTMEKTRLGVISPKRVFKLAVERSRARRLMREAFRLERPSLKPGYDLVLMGRAGLKGCTCEEVRKDLRWMCRKVGLLMNQAQQ